jgi:universal stress protein E
MLWRKVMLAVPDVDNLGTNVVDRVGRIARGLQADVELFACVYEPDLVQPGLQAAPDAVITARVEELHRRLERTGDALREQGLAVRSSVRWDYPMYEAVIRQVLRRDIDLLIMPARAAADVGQTTLHYREVRLIEECPCPVLLLKTPQVYSQGSIVAAVDPIHAYEVPEELDEGIMGAAKTLSYALAEAPVHLYHADAPPPEAAMSQVVPIDVASQASRRKLVHSRVRELAERYNIVGSHVHIDSGAIEVTLPAFARATRPDVIVMGALSRTYAERALLGHKAELVLDVVDCDLLIVKPRGFKTSIGVEAAPAVPAPASALRQPAGPI